MANKAVVRLDKILSSANGPLYSVKHTAELQNGQVVAIGDLATVTTAGTDASREVFDVKVASTKILLEDTKTVFALHASPEVIYNEGRWIENDGTIREANSLLEFSLTTGKIGRAYSLAVGDIFTVADTLITGATVKNQYVVPNETGGLSATVDGAILVATVSTKPTLQLKVIDKETLGVGRRGFSNNAQASTVLMVVSV